MTTLVNLTLIQEGQRITVRSDSLGEDEEVLSLGLQIIGYLALLEQQNPEILKVETPTLAAGCH